TAAALAEGSALAIALEPVVRDAQEITLGRSPSCDLQIEEGTISQVHLIFRREGEEWTVRDVGSTNGTWLEGTRRAQEAPGGRGGAGGGGSASPLPRRGGGGGGAGGRGPQALTPPPPCLALALGLLDGPPASSPPSATALRRAAEAGGRAWVRVQATASGPGVLVGADGQVLTVDHLLRGESALVQVAGAQRPAHLLQRLPS